MKTNPGSDIAVARQMFHLGYGTDSTKGDLHESLKRLESYIPFDFMRFRLTYDGLLGCVWQ
jgi:hypothetical protein